MMRQVVRFCLPAASLAALATCASPAADSVPWRTLRLGVLGEVQSLEPARAMYEGDRMLGSLSVETLVRADSAGGLRPGLAARWTSDAGHRVWIFHLRTDASFPDGTPFTSADVPRVWRRVLAAADSGSFTVATLRLIVGARADAATWPGVELPDDSTLVLRLDRAVADLPALLVNFGLGITAPSSSATRLVGTGPWLHAAGVPGDTLFRFARRPDVAADAPPFDSVRVVVLPELALAERLTSGALDCTAELSYRTVPDLARYREVLLSRSVPVAQRALHLPPGSPLATSRMQRRAVQAAIDVPTLAQLTGNTYSELNGSFVPSPFTHGAAQTAPVPYDPARARRQLADAVPPSAPALRFTPTVWGRDTVRSVTARIVGYLRGAGVRIEARTSPSDTAGADALEGVLLVPPVPHAYPYLRWAARRAAHQADITPSEQAALAAALDTLLAADAPAAKAVAITRMGALLQETMPAVPIWADRIVSASGPAVAGCPTGPFSYDFTPVRRRGPVA